VGRNLIARRHLLVYSSDDYADRHPPSAGPEPTAAFTECMTEPT